jgi:hypothetical protein
VTTLPHDLSSLTGFAEMNIGERSADIIV